MDGYNKWTGVGNLGADPELRVTPGGQSVLKLRLACSESYLDKSNTRQERTEWVSATVWGKRGEALAKILHKGDRLFVEGSLRTSSYEKDGEKRYRTEINVNEVVLCGGGGHRDDAGESRQEAPRYGTSGHGGSAKHTAPAEHQSFQGSFDADDEIPFIANMTMSGRWDRP